MSKNYISYITNLALFIGTGFISGAVVHSGDVSEITKYLGIGFVGVLLFVGASFVQEKYFNQENLKKEGAIKFILLSLLLSVGIGMISGGTQHFTDFPVYSSYLIPLGLVLSFVAFWIKNSFSANNNFFITLACLAVFGIVLNFGLITYAKSLDPADATHQHGITSNEVAGVSGHIDNEDHGDVIQKYTLNTSPYKLKINNTILAKSGNDFQVQVFDQNNIKQEKFDTNHGAQMHLIAIKDDFSEYQHLHPVLKDGNFIASYSFDKDGKYKLFADFIIEGKNSIVSQDLEVDANLKSVLPTLTESEDHQH